MEYEIKNRHSVIIVYEVNNDNPAIIAQEQIIDGWALYSEYSDKPFKYLKDRQEVCKFITEKYPNARAL